MTLRHAPADEGEVAAIVTEAFAAGMALAISGGSSAAGLGRPVEAEATLATAGLDGIVLHEPAELFITARAGTPVATVEAALAAKGQMLAFEPMDPRPLYGGGGTPTIGGLVAAAWSGPRRIAAGAVRDHLIGVRFVNGRGDAIKSGGRVVKNVTGLDLAKLMCGAHGTLGVITEATFRVLPRPERMATLVFAGLDDTRAIQALAAALGSPFEVTGAAHRPAEAGGADARTLIRIEGVPASIEYRLAQLAAVLAGYGIPTRMEGEDAAALWRDIRDGRPFTAPGPEAVWRLSTAPTRGPSLAALIGRVRPGRCFYDWGGGLIWLATPAEGDAGAAAIREAVAITGGHATLLRAPAAIRRAVPVFQPLETALSGLTGRIRQSLDPKIILNPGRMYPSA